MQLWSALECGSDDLQLAVPKPTSMDPIDRSCLKVQSPLWKCSMIFTLSPVLDIYCLGTRTLCKK